MTRLACLAALCLSVACGGAAGSGATVAGVYANAEGNASVEFLTGGRAHFSLHGVGGECTFAQTDRTVMLTCEGETTTFVVEDDGALAGPADSFLTRLKKKS
jgi:hypothetical protein